MKNITVFCGANNSAPKHFFDEIHNLGKLLAENGYDIIYGGSKFGCMGELANGSLLAGGNVTGVFPEKIENFSEQLKTDLSEIILTPDMHSRKLTMANLADCFIVFPGGYGTMDETFEIITWKAIGTHNKPIIIYNYSNYYDSFIAMTKNFIENGFTDSKVLKLYHIVTKSEEIISLLKSF